MCRVYNWPDSSQTLFHHFFADDSRNKHMGLDPWSQFTHMWLPWKRHCQSAPDLLLSPNTPAANARRRSRARWRWFPSSERPQGPYWSELSLTADVPLSHLLLQLGNLPFEWSEQEPSRWREDVQTERDTSSDGLWWLFVNLPRLLLLPLVPELHRCFSLVINDFLLLDLVRIIKPES